MVNAASTGVIAAVAQSLVFIGYDLIAKRLRERGIDSIQLSLALRHALIPSLIILAVAWDAQAIRAILNDSTTLLAFAGFMASALLFQWVHFKCLHVSHSLTVASVTRNAIGLPLLMLVGIFVNGDHPTAWGVASLGLMIAASFIKPGRTRLDRTQYIESMKSVLVLSASFVILVTIKDPLYRLFMQRSPSLILAVAIYMTIFSAALQLLAMIRPMPLAVIPGPAAETRWLMLLLPVIWVVGTIPEAIAFGLLPVYSMIAIGTVSWIIKIGTDLYFKRLAPTRRTAVFAALVVGSVGFSIVERSIT